MDPPYIEAVYLTVPDAGEIQRGKSLFPIMLCLVGFPGPFGWPLCEAGYLLEELHLWSYPGKVPEGGPAQSGAKLAVMRSSVAQGMIPFQASSPSKD